MRERPERIPAGYVPVVTFTLSKTSHKTVGIKVFLTFLLDDRRIRSRNRNTGFESEIHNGISSVNFFILRSMVLRTILM